jgi:hypothetical protein
VGAEAIAFLLSGEVKSAMQRPRQGLNLVPVGQREKGVCLRVLSENSDRYCRALLTPLVSNLAVRLAKARLDGAIVIGAVSEILVESQLNYFAYVRD